MTAATPLLSTPLIGKLYLTGMPLMPSLVIVFPAPFAFSLTGSFNLSTNTVNFPTVPDIPLTDLTVSIAGGSQGVFATTCTTATASGTVNGTFSGQNGASGTASGPFSISGCPAPAPTPVTSNADTVFPAPATSPAPLTGAATPTTAFSGSTPTGPGFQTNTAGPVALANGVLTRAGSRARLSLFVANRPGAPAFHSIRLSAPVGAHWVPGHLFRYVKSGAAARSVVLSHGQLVITLEGDAVQTHISISSHALALSAALARTLRTSQTKALTLKVAIGTTRRTVERITGKLRIG